MSERSRKRILERVRRAASQYEAPYPAGEVEASLDRRLSGADPEGLLDLFRQRQEELGGRVHVAETSGELLNVLVDRLSELADGPVWVEASLTLDRRPLSGLLAAQGVPGVQEASVRPESGEWKDVLAQASVGITGADWLLAQTGSVVLLHRPGRPRMLSLLPTHHFVVAPTSILLPDLDALVPFLQNAFGEEEFPSATIVTGSSRTADIEKILIKGVHGPQNLEVFLLRESSGD